MELELKKETLCFYEFSTAATAVHEEATETIVPDYCPDIARIIDSDGKVFLRGNVIINSFSRFYALHHKGNMICSGYRLICFIKWSPCCL